jgi:hypothetical protein
MLRTSAPMHLTNKTEQTQKMEFACVHFAIGHWIAALLLFAPVVRYSFLRMLNLIAKEHFTKLTCETRKAWLLTVNPKFLELTMKWFRESASEASTRLVP